MTPRRVRPEWLDSLPPDDPRAIASRRDLARVNGWMLQARWAARALRQCVPTPPRRWLDIGAGDGRFLLTLARKMAPAWQGATIILLDRQALLTEPTRAGFAALGMAVETRIGDVFEALDPGEPVDLITANLFLHHFDDDALRHLLTNLQAAGNALVCVEPRRSALALAGTRLLFLIGCNDVTRHDARLSVQAGFTGREITALWPSGPGWAPPTEAPAGPFSHVFTARRRSAA